MRFLIRLSLFHLFVLLTTTVIILFGMATYSSGGEPTVLPPYSFEVVRVRIHDVDTISGDVNLPWSVGLRNQTFRAAGFDGWEVSKTRKTGDFGKFTDREWEAEIAKGIKARDALRELANNGSFYVQWNPADATSVYGRLEGPFWVRTSKGQIVNVKQWAEQNGHVRK